MRNLFIGLGLAVMAPSIAAACPTISVGVTEVTVSAADISGAYYETPVVAGGDQDLSACGYAAGFVITQPDFSFHLTDISGPLPIAVNGGVCDTVLLVNDPAGNWWYDDDSGGDLQPYLEVNVTPGRLDVWVGTYNGELCDATLFLN